MPPFQTLLYPTLFTDLFDFNHRLSVRFGRVGGKPTDASTLPSNRHRSGCSGDEV